MIFIWLFTSSKWPNWCIQSTYREDEKLYWTDFVAYCKWNIWFINKSQLSAIFCCMMKIMEFKKYFLFIQCESRLCCFSPVCTCKHVLEYNSKKSLCADMMAQHSLWRVNGLNKRVPEIHWFVMFVHCYNHLLN